MKTTILLPILILAAASRLSAEPPPAAGAPAASQPATATKPEARSSSSKQGKGKPASAGKPAAPAKPPPPPPKPPVPNAALAQLKPLLGTWSCAGRTLGPGPEHATSASMSFSWQLDGFWLEVRYEETKGNAANPVPLSWIGMWGFDEVQQGLAAIEVDNIGGNATLATTGWQGDKLVLEGTTHRFAVQFQDRDSFVRHGDDQLVHTLEANVNDNWIKLHEDTCKRVPAK